MAANLKIGMVGLDTDLEHPSDINISQSSSRKQVSIRGHIKDTANLTEALAIRRQMLGQVYTEASPQIVAVDCTVDPDINGYYKLLSANVNASAQNASLISTGFLPYSVSLEEVPTPAFSVGVTGIVVVNDHAVTVGSPFVAPPGGASSFTPDGAPVSRDGEDGIVDVYEGIVVTDLPVFTCLPADFYNGACKLYVDSPLTLNPGPVMPDLPLAWRISNGLIRVSGNASGFFTLEMHNGTSWVSSRQWKMQETGSNIGTWDHVICTYNSPERVGISLVQNRSGTGRGRRTLDIVLRRGAVHASFYYTTTASSTIKIVGTNTEAGVASNPYGVRRSANDGSGNRWLVGTNVNHTNDTTIGGLSVTASVVLDFMVGFEVAGSGAQAGDLAANVFKQYIHPLAETVLPLVSSGV